MKINKLLTLLLVVGALSIESCGPVVISSTPNTPPPPWFYPNRVETIRYMYFPEYRIYYDLTLRSYIYWDNSVWITVDILPPSFHGIDLRRSRYIRIRDYYGDNIRSYHNNSRYSRSRSTRSRYDRSRNTRSRYDRNTTPRSRSSTRSRNTKSRDSIK